ncbi:MAG: hypothetical protein K6C12_06295 [Oscillospiraceae bacterium]|nr:hypothetical protein [Oscillospiraceae bacterium]
MNEPIFEFDTCDPLLPVSDSMAVGMNGHIRMRFSENMAMDMNTGEMHFTTPYGQ